MEGHEFQAIFFVCQRVQGVCSSLDLVIFKESKSSRGLFVGNLEASETAAFQYHPKPPTFRGPWHRGGGCPSCCCIATSRSRQGAAGAYAEAAGFAQYTREAVPGQIGHEQEVLGLFWAQEVKADV